ncbi:MAG: YdiU family protein [Leptolyngbyaceae bacterium]|nr:YdiU family protein [Leptolyngbyaceae bacterium]
MTSLTTSETSGSTNPLLTLNYEPALEALGEDFFDPVPAAEFPTHILRFRNDSILQQLGLEPASVTDEDFINAFGKFQGVRPFLALRYHGYQFGEYNPALGDGRGFLYGQVRGQDGELYDFGTKGSGKTPYSRGGDGKLTLKGGVREVLAAEALHALGVRTSRCFSLIETGQALYRGDEPSPTRSSVMIRFSRSHIRFGTFERFHALGRKDLTQKLLDHVIEYYYPHLWGQPDQYALFYAELVQRVAALVAQWMSVGFCHAVLNTDNMSITGESFDYGPYAFIETFDPRFTAAYFDYYGRYSYGNQPSICHWNLTMLQHPLKAVMAEADLEAGLAGFEQHYYAAYRQRMLNKLGLEQLPIEEADDLIELTLELLIRTQVGYHDFFMTLAQQFTESWHGDAAHILSSVDFIKSPEQAQCLEKWRQLYHRSLQGISLDALDQVAQRLHRHNPKTVLLRPKIESIWEPIVEENNWTPFYELVAQVSSPGMMP